MTFKLFGKIYSDGPVATFSSFRAAVFAGQKQFGHGQFHVEAPESYAPSREEQLLEVVDKSRRKRGDEPFESVQQKKNKREIAELRRQLLSTKDW